MGTWLNGASVNREKKKALPRSEPAQTGNIVLDAIARAVVAEHEAKIRSQAVGFLDRFLGLFSAYSHSSARSHKRRPPPVELARAGRDPRRAERFLRTAAAPLALARQPLMRTQHLLARFGAAHSSSLMREAFAGRVHPLTARHFYSRSP